MVCFKIILIVGVKTVFCNKGNATRRMKKKEEKPILKLA